MSSSLSKRWVCVCVVENLSRVFLSEWPPIHLWVMRVYIVWGKGKEFTHKNPPGRMFRDCLAGRPYPQDTREKTAWHDFSASSHVLLTCPFHGNPSHGLVAKCIDLQLSLSLHQLNTKPNTIKSHKIQGTKLEQL